MEKRLTQDEILALLEGQVDILTPAVREREEWFRLLRCPVCNGRCAPVTHPAPHGGKVFSENSLLPAVAARCIECSAVFEPHTRVIIEKGNATLVRPVTTAPGWFAPR